MAATIVGAADLTWGLSSEAGMIIESFTQENTVKEKPALDEQGEEYAVSMYGETETVNVSGYLTTASKSLAAAFTVANQTGSIALYQTTFRITGANEEFNKVDVTAKGWINIT